MTLIEYLGWEALLAGSDPLTLVELLDRPAWMRDALCREHPEVSFFPERGERTEPAKALCRRCLVRDECLAYICAADGGMAAHGIWGGTSAPERKHQVAA